MTDLAIITDLPAVVDCRKRAALIKAEADAIVVGNPEQKGAAIGVTSAISRLKHDAEAERIRLVKPLKDQASLIDRTFKDVLSPVVAADDVLRRKILDFDIADRRRAADAAAKAERERIEAEALELEAYRAAEDGKEKVAEQLVETAIARDESAKLAAIQGVAPAKTTVTPMGAATIRQIWTFEVVDIAEVPRAYFLLSEPMIREAIRQGARAIPGLRIFQQDSLSVRR